MELDRFTPRRRRVLQGLMLMAGASVLPRPAMAQELGKKGGTLTVAVPYDLDTLNTFSTGFLADIQSVVVEGLIAPDENTHYFPVLATEVPTLDNGGIVLSPDGSKMDITFKLREGVLWSDGQPFTSDDVKFTWEAIKDPKFTGESKEGVTEIDSIETPDPLTAIVHFNTVTPVWPSGFFSRGILPKHALEGKDLNTDPYNDKPLGTGPFVITEFKRGQYVIADRNPNYWRKDANGVQLPYIDRMVFNLTPDASAMVTRLRSGEIMLAYNIPYGQAQALSSSFDIVVNKILSWQHLDFNFKGPAPLADVNVRRAFAHAINKDTIVKALNGYPFVVNSVISPQFDYYDPDIKTYPYDPEAAKKLLDDAGYVMGADGVRAKDGQQLAFNITVQAGTSQDETAEQIIMANMKAVGVKLTADNKNGVAFRDARYKGLYDMLYARWITAADPAYSVFFGSKGANNGQGYADPKMDALLDQAEHTIDRAKLKAIFKDIQALIADQVVSIPTTCNVSLIAKTAQLKNFVPNPTNRTIFNNTSSWYLET